MSGSLIGNDKIYLSGLAFHGFHGALPEEIKLGQRFTIDLVLHLDLHDACESDQLVDSVDYSEVFELVRSVVEGDRVRLIETLAGRISAAIFAQFQRVQSIRVRVSKPGAPIRGIFCDVGVDLERKRVDSTPS